MPHSRPRTQTITELSAQRPALLQSLSHERDTCGQRAHFFSTLTWIISEGPCLDPEPPRHGVGHPDLPGLAPPFIHCGTEVLCPDHFGNVPHVEDGAGVDNLTAR